jgi:heme/copper-type cytochrome/quinol oxidase subunit 2
MITNSRSWLLYAVIGWIALSLGGCSRTPKPTVHIDVVMKKYSILPAEIRAKQGDIVELRVVAADVQHSFDVPELGIKEPVQPGKPAVFSFRADKKGKFAVECGILCGPHHDDMRAVVVVE